MSKKKPLTKTRAEAVHRFALALGRAFPNLDNVFDIYNFVEDYKNGTWSEEESAYMIPVKSAAPTEKTAEDKVANIVTRVVKFIISKITK